MASGWVTQVNCESGYFRFIPSANAVLLTTSPKASNLISKINPIIANYASDKNISIIIRKDSMIMGKTELDISSDIINLVNKDIKE